MEQQRRLPDEIIEPVLILGRRGSGRRRNVAGLKSIEEIVQRRLRRGAVAVVPVSVSIRRGDPVRRPLNLLQSGLGGFCLRSAGWRSGERDAGRRLKSS